MARPWRKTRRLRSSASLLSANSFACLRCRTCRSTRGQDLTPEFRLPRNVVAFAGMQQGGQIMIITYNCMDGWIDGTKIAPFHGAPGQRCIVPGRDRLQRPIFEID